MIRRSHSAFTLVEIMIVVGIVAVLITLAMPNILRSRITANEGAALGNIRTINQGCHLYHIQQGSFPQDLNDLVEINPPYIDSALGSGSKQGYDFIYVNPDPDSFTLNANPATALFRQGRYFYIDQNGIIRAKIGGPAGPGDEAVG
ncbi:type II secretion system protein [Candidatus Omnitrophota bacterium]